MLQLWQEVMIISIVFCTALLGVGVIGSCGIFIGKTWEHINQAPASITAKNITMEGPTTISGRVDVNVNTCKFEGKKETK